MKKLLLVALVFHLNGYAMFSKLNRMMLVKMQSQKCFMSTHRPDSMDVWKQNGIEYGDNRTLIEKLLDQQKKKYPNITISVLPIIKQISKKYEITSSQIEESFLYFLLKSRKKKQSKKLPPIVVGIPLSELFNNISKDK